MEQPVVFGKRLFQVAVSDEQLEERLNRTEPFSRTYTEPELKNCSNLTLVLLGIVSGENYLKICTERHASTTFEELKDFVEDAFRKCGRNVTVDGSPSIDIEQLKGLADGLLPGYATYVSLNRAGTTYDHAVFLFKDKCKKLFLIDAQVGEDRLYPEQAIGINRILKYLKNDRYTTFSFIETTENGIIHEGDLPSCTTDAVPHTPAGPPRMVVPSVRPIVRPRTMITFPEPSTKKRKGGKTRRTRRTRRKVTSG